MTRLAVAHRATRISCRSDALVLAYHVIFGTYGFWLPNDPRGSWSDFVRQWELYRYGAATQVQTRASLAHRPHNRELREQAKTALTYPPVIFNGLQARAVARGFGAWVEKSGGIVHACSILPEHVHLVLGRHRYHAEQMVNLLKGEASWRLEEEAIHPLQWVPREEGRRLPSPWARGCWKVFLSTDDAVHAAIVYVRNNPLKEGKRAQAWWFTPPYTPS